MIGYRFFEVTGDAIKSANGNLTWPAPGGWVTHEGEVEMCRVGLHASPTISAALRNRQGSTLGRVESDDPVAKDGDEKYVTRRMRIEKLYSRRQLAGLAALASAMTLHHFEDQYPKDDRPRKAILACLEYVRSGTWSAASAARAARAACAESAASAASAAWAASAAREGEYNLIAEILLELSEERMADEIECMLMSPKVY